MVDGDVLRSSRRKAAMKKKFTAATKLQRLPSLNKKFI